jgi:hypothetical protein
MGFTRFPVEKDSKQLKSIQSCCPGHAVPWDCGCSWGCPLCWVAYECSVCNHKYSTHIALEHLGAKEEEGE